MSFLVLLAKDDMGESVSAIEDLNKYVKMTADSYFGYYRRDG